MSTSGSLQRRRELGQVDLSHESPQMNLIGSGLHPPPSFPTPRNAVTELPFTTPTTVNGSYLPTYIPSRLPYHCTSVQLRGGPLLQPVTVGCDRVRLDFSSREAGGGTITLNLKWPQPPSQTDQMDEHEHKEKVNSPQITDSKKRLRRIERNSDEDLSNSDREPFSTPFSSSSNASQSTALVPSSKRTRANANGMFHTPTPMAHSHHRRAVSSFTAWPSPRLESVIETKWTIPLSSIVGVDFAISLDTPGTCTFALKPSAVYTIDSPTHKSDQSADSSVAVAGGREGRRASINDLSFYSPTRLILSSYQSVAASHPARFNRASRWIERYLPPLAYWIWLHSTYQASFFLILGLILTYIRFWMTSTSCFLIYLVLLVQEFIRSQKAFEKRVLEERQPMAECLYVHLVFAREAYTSFLGFRRLFVAAAPVFSTPSSSSTEPSVFISQTMPGDIQFNSTSSASDVQTHYPITHLQNVLPTCPLFFGNVYVDFVCYLILPPQIFASPRVRSVTHFLLPLLYLGQAMVAAVRALTPVAVQGYIFLAPYMLIELHWFVTVFNSIPNPFTRIFELLLPLHWIRLVLGSWLLDVIDWSWRSWSYVLSIVYTLTAPIRWINAVLSPTLEFIRQEMRALWGLNVLFQPLVTVLLRLQVEFVRLWEAFSSSMRMFSALFSAFLPARLFSLFGAMKSGASATAAVGSGISASGGISRWRAMYQSTLEFFTLIGKWKLVIDRIRVNIQNIYYERIMHVKQARNLHQHGDATINPNLDVPLVASALERSTSELSDGATPLPGSALQTPISPEIESQSLTKLSTNDTSTSSPVPRKSFSRASLTSSPMRSPNRSPKSPSVSTSMPSYLNSPTPFILSTPLPAEQPYVSTPACSFSGYDNPFSFDLASSHSNSSGSFPPWNIDLKDPPTKFDANHFGLIFRKKAAELKLDQLQELKEDEAKDEFTPTINAEN